MPVVLLPFVNTSDSLSADSLKLDDAWAYIGQTIIIKNRADNLTIRVRGGGSIDKTMSQSHPKPSMWVKIKRCF